MAVNKDIYIHHDTLTKSNRNLCLKGNSVTKIMEKYIFIHNIEVPYIGDYTVIDK